MYVLNTKQQNHFPNSYVHKTATAVKITGDYVILIFGASTAIKPRIKAAFGRIALICLHSGEINVSGESQKAALGIKHTISAESDCASNDRRNQNLD